MPSTTTLVKGSEMIYGKVHGNIFYAPRTHIAFAVNCEGVNDSGFAAQVANFWPEIQIIGTRELGEVITQEINGITYHALVCYSLRTNGWDKTPDIVRECLNSLEIPDDEIIACVLMGNGFIGQIQGADIDAILKAIDRSNKKVEVYTLN